MAKKPCQVPGCELPKFAPRHRCVWHWLLTEPIDLQIGMADQRLSAARGAPGFVERARVPAESWPAGTRWCAGCQTFIPTFYAQGSRCKACASLSTYSSHLKKTYGITYDDYRRMFEWQGGRCYICRRRPAKKRLAVDHNHATGEVRGLLCTDGERGCNHAILGNITSLDMAKRIVLYLEDPPLQAMRAGRPVPELVSRGNPAVQKGVHKATPGIGDGVRIGYAEVMAALVAEEGLNAAGERVPRHCAHDITDIRHPMYGGERPPFDTAPLPDTPFGVPCDCRELGAPPAPAGPVDVFADF
jgi:hypothetical protein